MRSLKLLDRLCRHLVAVGVRESNPANQLVRDGRWPKDEPAPIYLPEHANARLQAWIQSHDGDDLAVLRSRAIVAFFLATGVTAAEARSARREYLQPGSSAPYLRVPAHGARDTRAFPWGPSRCRSWRNGTFAAGHCRLPATSFSHSGPAASRSLI
ncbi:hypothetical protein [Cupriavidus sp. YAF13]|uniref:hypothetical protein n=1 Tax=Cupriavidus sp. YAF13 TaxID=3233075 RepID=UPI003F918344